MMCYGVRREKSCALLTFCSIIGYAVIHLYRLAQKNTRRPKNRNRPRRRRRRPPGYAGGVAVTHHRCAGIGVSIILYWTTPHCSGARDATGEE